MKILRFIPLLLFPVYLLSCKPQQAMPDYLDQVNDTTGKGEVKMMDLKIQKGDILSIQINSLSTDLRADILYNMPAEGSISSGYLVDLQGNIDHHRLGTIHAAGLTKQELAVEIKKRLTVPVELLRDPTVVIRFQNFRINVLGEVARAGQIIVPGERLTILEAITLAGGVTEYGKKNSIKIIRETNGQRETGYIDLTSKNVFDSPYYNLAQNDVILISPTKQRIKEADQQKVFQKISFGLSLVMAVTTLTNLLIR
ncbi:MAG: polysaccharide biosynthesis/export family protein [Chitinophagaceae bacterium]|nr:polysaccharide biosynthesis/export family protein [Chitinophagaceae bacterium]